MTKSFAGLLLGISVPAAVWAQGSAVGNYYAMFDPSWARLGDACSAMQAIAAMTCASVDSALPIMSGYAFARKWGLEMTFANLSASLASAPLGTASFTSTATQLAATQVFGPNGNFSVQANVALVRSVLRQAIVPYGFVADTSTSQTTYGFGIGGQFDFTSRTRLRLQYQGLANLADATAASISRVQLFSAGFVYSF